MITGGIGRPTVFPPIEAKFCIQSGTTPNTVPAENVPIETSIWTPPFTKNPTPNVRINACPWSLKLKVPLTNPIKAPNNNITIQASHGGTPFEINDIKATFIEPITNGIERSKPPKSATNVWPIVANPRNDAKTNIDFIFIVVKNPGIVKDPIINKPIKTDIPIKTLLVPFMYLLMTPIKITNTKKIKNETRVLPEKKLSETKDTKIKIRIIPRKAIVFHLFSLMFLKKKFSSSSSSSFIFSSLGNLVKMFCFKSSLIHLTEKWYHPHNINPVTAIE